MYFQCNLKGYCRNKLYYQLFSAIQFHSRQLLRVIYYASEQYPACYRRITMITKCELFFMDYFYKRRNGICYLHDNNNGSI
jgi:hypothetical protein